MDVQVLHHGNPGRPGFTWRHIIRQNMDVQVLHAGKMDAQPSIIS